MPNFKRTFGRIFSSDLCKLSKISYKKNSNKYSKSQKTKFIQNYFNPYDSTPGDCTRSKTLKYCPLNPFDLSNPNQKLITNFKGWEFMPPPNLKGSSTIFNSSYETESILSFASRSNDEDSRSSFGTSSDSSLHNHSKELLSKIQETSSPINSCLETGYLLPIVSETSNEIFIPQISSSTLAKILTGNHTLNNELIIFDCRFPYEYVGGHIINSINVYTSQKLLQTLFPIQKNQSESNLEDDISTIQKKLKNDDRIYVFYCEYSSYRAPKLAQCLRILDRLAHFGGRDLYIPNIYVLFGGYRDFYNEFPQLCSPNDYVKMKQTRYPLRNYPFTSACETISQSEILTNQYRKEEKQFLRELQDSEKKLHLIIEKSKKKSDILNLFLSHPIIGNS